MKPTFLILPNRAVNLSRVTDVEIHYANGVMPNDPDEQPESLTVHYTSGTQIQIQNPESIDQMMWALEEHGIPEP